MRAASHDAYTEARVASWLLELDRPNEDTRLAEQPHGCAAAAQVKSNGVVREKWRGADEAHQRRRLVSSSV